MAVVTITEAAKTWNCGRATIYRKLNAGTLSGADMPDGGRGVDTSEMLRVFGPAVSTDVREDAVRQGPGRDLIQENAHLMTLIAEKDGHIETLKQAMRLLEHRQPPPPAPLQDQRTIAMLEDEKRNVQELQQKMAAIERVVAEQIEARSLSEQRLGEANEAAQQAVGEVIRLAEELEREKHISVLTKFLNQIRGRK